MSQSQIKSSDSSAPLVLWFRDDLRLADNPALDAASKSGRVILPIFIFDQVSPHIRKLGGASRWWLHGSLEALTEDLELKGGKLHLFEGPAETVLNEIIDKTGSAAVHWNRRYGEAERAIDSHLKESLSAKGLDVKSFNSHLLREPWEVKTQAGTPMKVFTPFWKAARAIGDPPATLPVPISLNFKKLAPNHFLPALSLDELKLKPSKPNWAEEIEKEWQPGERKAAEKAEYFITENARNYSDNRNRPDKASTSKLSPHLRFGEISPRQIWHATRAAIEAGRTNAQESDLDKFLAEIGWREFSYHLLFHFPKLGSENFLARFNDFPWAANEDYLSAWQKGQTGYPIVDAGMRELWQTGWMHNRVRMVTASFLIKHLMVDWRRGEEWFWDTLVDADPASNAASWQWVAGSGADAAPYYRIFAPVVQGEKFDPNGEYIRRFVPELSRLPNAFIHKPWEAPHPVLSAAGITLGKNYPKLIVDHRAARDRALEAFKSLTAVEQ